MEAEDTQRIHWTESGWWLFFPLVKVEEKFRVIGNSTRYPMMHSMLDNGKDFCDLHTQLEICYLELCSGMK